MPTNNVARPASCPLACCAVLCAILLPSLFAVLLWLHVDNAEIEHKVPHLNVHPTCWRPTRRLQENTSPPAGLVLVSILSGLPDRATDCLRRNRRAYAERHGHEYCEYDANLLRFRSFGIQKVVALHHILSGRPDGTWGWWLDGDAVIMDRNVSLLGLLRRTTADIVHASEPESRAQFEFGQIFERLDGGRATLATTRTGANWTIQCGSYAVRNSRWARGVLHRVAAGFGHSIVPPFVQRDGMWQLSDRAQWIRWALRHPAEAKARMELWHSRVFDSMHPDYRDGDFIFHAGGGGAFGPVKTHKYTEIAEKCEAANKR